MTTPGNTKSKSKTFQKGEGFGVIMDWLCENIETLDYKPEGIDQDPQWELVSGTEVKYDLTPIRLCMRDSIRWRVISNVEE